MSISRAADVDSLQLTATMSLSQPCRIFYNVSVKQKKEFFWWNELHPEVQDFMNKLVLEVVNNYNIDGIQGDDCLPAVPGEGG